VSVREAGFTVDLHFIQKADGICIYDNLPGEAVCCADSGHAKMISICTMHCSAQKQICFLK